MATVGELFTEAEIEKAKEIYADAGPGEFAARCAKEVVEPALARIDRVTGQGNDPRYLAYVLEYALGQASRPGM